MLKLKVCGLTDLENIKQIISLEPDMIGFVFHNASVRNANPDLFNKIRLSNSITKVGVFVDQSRGEIEKIVEQCTLNMIQVYHEDISNLQSLRSKVKIIKAISISNSKDLTLCEKHLDQCDYFLFDTKGEKTGGNGIKFNWQLLENYKLNKPFILSGGISPEDAEKINSLDITQLLGIDINSKFEIKPGIKNIEQIKTFKIKLHASTEHTK